MCCVLLINAQLSTTIPLKINLVDAIIALEKEKNIHIAYDPIQCQNYQVFNYHRELPNATILDDLLSSTPFRFKLQEKNHYLIYLDTDKFKELETASKQFRIEISGSVRDRETKEALVGALVIIMPEGIATSTDEEGRYKINNIVKFENSWLELRYLGYQNQTLPLNTKITNYNFSLIQNITNLPSVEINGIKPLYNYNRLIGLGSGQTSSLSLIVGRNVFNDPIRSLHQVSGVNATEDRSVGLQIRGSNPEENLILLNGLMLFNVDHFYGIFSSINPYIVSEINFYKSYFPARFGGRSSSVLQINSAQKNDLWSGGLDLNLITSNAYFNIPLTKKINLLVAGRHTTSKLGEHSQLNNVVRSNNPNSSFNSDSSVITRNNPDYKFYDFYSKLDVDLSKYFNITASYFRSFDKTFTNYNVNFDLDRNVVFSGIFRDSSEWLSEGFLTGLKGEYTTGLNYELTYSNSKFNFAQQINSSTFVNNRVTSLERTKVTNQVSNTNIKFLNHYVSDEIKLDFGIEYNQFSADVMLRNLLKEKGREYEIAPFIQSTQQFNKFIFSPGLRLNYYSLKKNPDISPRINMSYSWNKKWTSLLNYGIYYQYLRQVRFEDPLAREYNLWTIADIKKNPILKSHQYEFINSFKHHNITIKLELYFKQVNGITDNIIFSISSPDPTKPGTFQPRSLVGNGRYYGLDFSYDQKINNYSIGFIYSYNKSLNSFEAINNGNFYQKPYVRTHQVKLLQSISIKRFTLNLNSVFGSQLPYYDIAIVTKDAKDREVINFIKYLDNYLRIDSDLRYTFSLKKSRLELSFSVLNVLDQQNLKFVQSLFRVPNSSGMLRSSFVIGAEVENLRRTVNFGVAYHF
ncbi:MAG: TonB-dependent receptor [Saprospiraceae bacterium]|nr:TonB-dependent receptor [Saprospiraceae bacterium]